MYSPRFSRFGGQSTYNTLGTIIYLGKTKSKHLRIGLLVFPSSSRWDRRGAVLVRYLYYVSDPSLAIRLLWGGVFRSPSQYFWAGSFFGAQGLLPLAHTHWPMLGLGIWGWTWEVLGWGGSPVAQFETYLLNHAKLEKALCCACGPMGLHLNAPLSVPAAL